MGFLLLGYYCLDTESTDLNFRHVVMVLFADCASISISFPKPVMFSLSLQLSSYINQASLHRNPWKQVTNVNKVIRREYISNSLVGSSPEKVCIDLRVNTTKNHCAATTSQQVDYGIMRTP